MAKRKSQPRFDTPDGPAIIRPDFAQTRHISTRAGAAKGWERLPVYEQEFRRGHLFDKAMATSTEATKRETERAQERRDACQAFDEGWAICNASWPSGFDPGRIRVAGCPGSFADNQRDTKAFWRRVEFAMGPNDWMICRRVCGEGWRVAETVRTIAPSYRDETLVRFREAVDVLIAAMEASRQSQQRPA